MALTQEKTSDSRYHDVLQQFDMLGETTISDLLSQLDEAVGERLADTRDKAIAEATGGFVVNGQIELDDASINGWGPVRLKGGQRQLNPSFDECGCMLAETFRGSDREAEGLKVHDLLLSLNGPSPMGSISEIVYEVVEGTAFSHRCGPVLDVEDFETFFAQHRWADQVSARALGQMLDRMWVQYEREDLMAGVLMNRIPLSELEGHWRHKDAIRDMRKVLAKGS